MNIPSDREIWQRAIDMLNEIHDRMGIDMVLQAKMERLAVDKIAEKHMLTIRDDMVKLMDEVTQQWAATVAGKEAVIEALKDDISYYKLRAGD